MTAESVLESEAPAASVVEHTATIASSDGARIAVREYTVPTVAPTGSVVVACAMGVRQDFYVPLAQWLAQQGWRVTTFDYRGSGDSLPDTAMVVCGVSRRT